MSDPGLIDPICGMTVAPDSPRRFEFDGYTYFFCSDHCLKKFSADPEKYVKGKLDPGLRRDDTVARSPDAIHTCPMHPEVRHEGPGVCPKCGMALEPEVPSVEEGENPELVDFRRRFWSTLPLTAVVVILAMWGHVLLPTISVTVRTWAELVLATPVVAWAGWPFLERCVASIR